MIRKRWRIALVIVDRFLFWTKKRNILIEYGGATILQNIELMNCKTDKERYQFFWDFIKNNTKTKITQKLEKKINPSFGKIVEQIVNTAFKIPKIRGNIDTNSDNSPYSSYIVFLSKELGIEPRKLINYTIQEIDYLTEGLTWNINMRTEEGEKKNREYAQKLRGDEVLYKHKKEIDEFLRS